MCVCVCVCVCVSVCLCVCVCVCVSVSACLRARAGTKTAKQKYFRVWSEQNIYLLQSQTYNSSEYEAETVSACRSITIFDQPAPSRPMGSQRPPLPHYSRVELGSQLSARLRTLAWTPVRSWEGLPEPLDHCWLVLATVDQCWPVLTEDVSSFLVSRSAGFLSLDLTCVDHCWPCWP